MQIPSTIGAQTNIDLVPICITSKNCSTVIDILRYETKERSTDPFTPLH